MSRCHVVGRRAFLSGAGGITLGLPFLSMFAGKGYAQDARPPRLVIVFHSQGVLPDRWKPKAEGTLPLMLPELLEPLTSFRDRLNIISGIDNVVRDTMTASNGHNGAARSLFTCQPFQGVKGGSQPDNGPADGPSIDWVIGPKIQGEAARPVVNLAVNSSGLGENTVFWQSAGQSAGQDSDPVAAASKLFSGLVTSTPAEPKPLSAAELLKKRRGSVLDVVLDGYTSLLKRAPAEDRARLEAHAEQVRTLERLTAGSGGAATASCMRPDIAALLPGGYDPSREPNDVFSAAAQIENAAMALTCDITRCVTLQHAQYDDPRFPWLFGGDSGAIIQGQSSYSGYHDMVHKARSNADGQAMNNLATAYTWYMRQVADLATRLSQIEDGPGQTLLDNTVILAMSEFGDGGGHGTTGLPVALLGTAGGRLRAGQHLALDGHTSGDLFTTLQALLTSDETPFGMTGTVSNRPLHSGLLPGLA